jgi:SDR family mycofactocin-dependent oxidoreductase
MGVLEGKVALVTGAARGMGRSHALRLAEEGASVIALDLCAQIATVDYPMSTPEDLAETVAAVEAQGGRIVASIADVRDPEGLGQAVRAGVDELGRLDVVVANPGIAPLYVDEDARADAWRDVIDVNLTGVWNSVDVATPALIASGGGSVTIISSAAGLRGLGGDSVGMTAYTAAKHAVVGLMRTLARQLGPHSIRVNTVHPGGVGTAMSTNDSMRRFLVENEAFAHSVTNVLPVRMVEPLDVSNAVVWLGSDAARFVTGVTLPVDAGCVL